MDGIELTPAERKYLLDRIADKAADQIAGVATKNMDRLYSNVEGTRSGLFHAIAVIAGEKVAKKA